MLKTPEITNNPFRDTLNVLKFFLTSRQKKNMVIMGFLILTSALMDVLGLASILPLIKISTVPSFIHENEYLSRLYSMAGAESNSQFIMYFVLAILTFFIFKGIYGLIVVYLQARLSTNVVMNITQIQYDKYYKMNYHQFSGINSSQVIHQIMNIPQNFVAFVFTPALTLITEIMIISLIIIGIASYNLVLFGLIALAVAPASLSIYYSIRKKSRKFGRELDTARPKALNALTTAIMGYVDILLINKGNHYSEIFKKWQRKFYDQSIKSNMMNFIPMRGYEIVAILGVVVIFMYAHWFASQSDDVLIFVGMFAAAAYRLMPSLNRIMSAILSVETNQVSLGHLYRYSNENYLIEKNIIRKNVSFEKELQIKDVSFRFPDSDDKVLDKVNLFIRKGETVGIVGPSGSGKTTLLNIILRFYQEEEGSLIVDNIPLSEEHKISWRSKLGYVKQDIFLLDGTIAENIALGENEINKERLNSVIKQSSLWEFIQTLENGAETKIGEKGNKLSGGQKQRIGIARALYRDAEILIFDEATSALDSKTEQEVSEAITKLSETKKTIFIVAHRITTLKNCSRIYEIKDGKIGGVHSYNELVEKIL